MCTQYDCISSDKLLLYIIFKIRNIKNKLTLWGEVQHV